MRLRGMICIAAAMTFATVAQANSLDQVTRATVAINCRTETGGFVGTGVVVSPAGYVLTSTTVVPPKAFDIKCHFPCEPGKPVAARLVLADEKLELAIVKLTLPPNTPAIALGNSRALQIGQTVFSVGDSYTAFARSGKFCTSIGVLSGVYDLKRQIAPQPVYVGRALETTAAVAPGMDGGPMLDGAGRLIGVLSLNVSEARWMGVAVPLDAFFDKMEQAIAADAYGPAATQPGHVRPATQPDLFVYDESATPIFPVQELTDQRFARIARQIAPAVVTIEVDRKAERQPTTRPATTRPANVPPRPQARPQVTGPYREFFNRPKTPVTGLLVSPDGHVVTTFFNVSGDLRSVQVVLADGRRFPAKLLGQDEANDLAMLKIDAAGLPAATLSTDAVTRATRVAVLGRSPDAERYTLTRGIVSAVGRMSGKVIQVDAQTNYGNAGGPVIDVQGRVIGLVAHIRPDALWGQNSGLGFATASPTILAAIPEMKRGIVIAKPKRGFLGLTLSDGNIESRGVVVDQVMPQGPCAGVLQARDVITHVDEQPVADRADLTQKILDHTPGDVVQLTVRRGAQTLLLDVTLAEHPYQ